MTAGLWPPSQQTLLDSLYVQAASLLNPLADAPEPPADYPSWLEELFPAHVTAPLADHHHRIWQWVWALERGVRPDPLVVLLARGGAKSTSAEMACVAVGAHRKRRYALYISGTQKQADDHVGNVASMLESPTVATYYPDLSERDLNKFGVSKGWRHNRLRTAAGFTVDALGLDVDVRGIRLEENRPDLLILDDVDDAEDSIDTVKKKIRIITQKILPAGSSDVATLFVQNIVHYESVAARLAGRASEEADFLAGREVIGPVPALVGFKAEKIPGTVRWRITSGTPTWEGQNRETCQAQVDDWGIKAFRAEAQHERTPPEGQAFPEWDASVHVVEPETILPSWPRFRAVDYGYAAPFCCLWGARKPDGSVLIYRELYGPGMTASEQALQIRILSAGETYSASVGDPSMWASSREGTRFKSVADQYREVGVRLEPATNDRLAGWERIHEYLDWDEPTSDSNGFAPRLAVSKRCTNLIRTLPLLTKDPHKPEDVDTDLEDHACFVAGTPVLGEHGEQPIETIRAGDHVWTRNGLRRVLAAGQTSEQARVLTVQLSNGRTLTGTGNHPVWVHPRGWKRLDALRYGDILEVCENVLKPLSSKVSPTADILTVRDGQMRPITVRALATDAVAAIFSTATSTASITARFLTAMTFIIAITTLRTTIRATSKPSQSKNITATGTGASLVSGSCGRESISSRWLRSLLRGIGRIRGAHGTVSTGGRRSLSANLSSGSVKSVENGTSRSNWMTPLDSARTTASQSGGATLDWIMSSVPVSIVSSRSASTVICQADTAPVSVVSVRAVRERQPVYNLTVEGRPEYFAAGVLVHNCDALRYLMMAATASSSLTGVLAKTVKRNAAPPDKQIVAPHVSNASERARELAEISDPRIRRRMALMGNGRGGRGDG